MAQNDKKICLSRFISQTSYIMWLPFMVRMCKMMTSPGVFFFSSFQNFNVLGYHGAKAVKNMVQIDKHILSIAPLIFNSWAESWVSWLNLVYLENHSLNPENPAQLGSLIFSMLVWAEFTGLLKILSWV